MGFFDRIDFKLDTITEGGRRVVVADVTRKRPWRIDVIFFFWRPGANSPDLEFKTTLDEAKKTIRISDDEIQTGEFEVRVFSTGPLGVHGREEDTVNIP